MYEYKAYVEKVYDADTITVTLDLGFNTCLNKQKIRLSGIDAPEVRGDEKEEGKKSRDALRKKILKKWVTIKTTKDKKGKYGRWLGEVWLDDVNINRWLVAQGYAKGNFAEKENTQQMFKDPRDGLIEDLTVYYGVSKEKAIRLGSRGDGRKPDLPGSKTCEPVSGKTYEDIWGMSDRSTNEGIFQFYKDQGAWSAFRQVVRHLDLLSFHAEVWQKMGLGPDMHICEYGCGSAPFTRSLAEIVGGNGHDNDLVKLKISLSDVPCEHFEFGKWRVENAFKNRGLNSVTVEGKEVLPDRLPTYSSKLDRVIMFEVLEHVPSPLDCIKNLHSQMNPSCLFLENFIKHDLDEDEDGPDLSSARKERDAFYDFVKEKFNRVLGKDPSIDPNGTRIWMKK